MRAVIADDEQLARHRVVRLLGAMPEVEVVAECKTGQEVLTAVEAGDVDVCFLDLHMPGLTGAEVAGLLGPDGPLVVFLTAHADHAVEAFATGAVDYILKPVEARRLAEAVARVRERLPQLSRDLQGRLALPTSRGAVLLDQSDISHATIDGASVVVHSGTQQQHFTELRLADLARRLDHRFLRLHRQALVNVEHIVRLEDVDSGGYLAHLRDGSTVAVSRAAARELRRDWGLPR